MKTICRDVKTGRFASTSSALDKVRGGENWFEVAGYKCQGECRCDGYEVFLKHISNYVGGGGVTTPVWPVLSLRSEDEVVEWVKKLTAFARTLDPDEDLHDHHDKEVNGDARLAAWLKTQGFTKRSNVLFAREEA